MRLFAGCHPQLKRLTIRVRAAWHAAFRLKPELRFVQAVAGLNLNETIAA